MMNLIINNKLQNIMKATSQFFSEFDLFQCSATLRTQGQKQMKNPSTGFFLFIISCFFVYIFVSGCVGILKQQKIDAQLLDLVLPQNDVVGYFNTLAIRVGNFSFEQIKSMFAPVHVTVTVEQQYSDQYNLMWQSMVPCQPEHWIGLGENYKESFYYYGIDKMLCLNLTKPARLNETQISWTSTYIIIKFYLCNYVKNMSSNCNASKALNYLQSHNNIEMNLYLLDTGFFPVQRVSTKPFVNIDSKILISWLTTTNVEVQYASYRIETDQSLVSFTSDSVSQGIWVSKIRNYARPYNYTDENLDLTRIIIIMNQNQRVYQRTIGKLDNLISYVGGLFQMLIIFIAFFLLSFDEYKYELEVADGAFQYCKDGKQIKYSDMSFITYIKYSIYEWTNMLLCMKLKWKLCNQIDEIRKQIISLMEVNRLYKRIRNVETAVTYALGEHKTDFIKLVEPPSIAKVNNRKLKIDYYDQVADHHVAYELTNKLILTEQSLAKETEIKSGVSLQKQKKTESGIKKEAKSIQLSPELFEIQKDFVNSLLALNPRRRALYEARISPNILHRLKQKSI